ncbi:MAG: hypothetical protein VX589_02205 [Myxococcota bacterium]|nr:hypothetical protein [Myxococcota bacterium]
MTDDESQRRSIFQQWTTWAVIAIVSWFGYLASRAYTELTDRTSIQGLFRVYDRPFQGSYGSVVDPRPWTTVDILTKRFGVRGGGPQLPSTPKAWCDWLSAAQIACRVVDQASEADNALRLRFVPGQSEPHLWLGRFGLNHVFFVPGEGVTLSAGLPPAATILRLPELREAPW